MNEETAPQPLQSRLGKLLLLSSGETSATGRRMHQRMFTDLGAPVRAAVLETPAGFEVNSSLVAQKVSDYLTTHLPNFVTDVCTIPARRKDGPLSTNDEQILAPMLDANYLYLGAGSPTYLVEHMKDSLALSYLLGRFCQGASLCFASAAAIAFGARTIPVYEIFKVGQDPYWTDGLDFFGLFGLDLAIVSHWNNAEGGEQLDTSCCFMGKDRMERLQEMLLPTTLVLGIDEHSGLIFDFQEEQCQVVGKGDVTIISPGSRERYPTGSKFPIQTLGPYHPPIDGQEYGSPVKKQCGGEKTACEPSAEVLELIQQRERSRQAHNWAEADSLRQQVTEAGFEIQDTPNGPQWHSIVAQ